MNNPDERSTYIDSFEVGIFHLKCLECSEPFRQMAFWRMPSSLNININGWCVLMPTFVSQAYPAFTGGVSGPFVLDLRFPAHRLAAVRLAEAENFQER